MFIKTNDWKQTGSFSYIYTKEYYSDMIGNCNALYVMKRKISKINYRKKNLEHYNLGGKKKARIYKYT